MPVERRVPLICIFAGRYAPNSVIWEMEDLNSLQTYVKEDNPDLVRFVNPIWYSEYSKSLGLFSGVSSQVQSEAVRHMRKK